MRWEKLGMIYCPSGSNHPKLATHAANPLAVRIAGDLYRVFFSGRDAQNRSSVGCVDLDITSQQVVKVHPDPVFEHGPEGSYYSHGVSIGTIYEAGPQRYLLFMGWQCPPESHWRGDIGRLVLGDDLSLRIEHNLPLMGVAPQDPISLSYPWVLQDCDGSYQMWYGSTLTWDSGNGEMVHVINRATSADGHNWNRCGLSVPYRVGEAQAFSRPCVLGSRQTGFEMWFSYRRGTGDKYRIGYATSPDGEHWRLKLDEAGIDVSSTGWDSEMIEYPFVFDHRGQRYMLYNGNGFGRTGFGLAAWC